MFLWETDPKKLHLASSSLTTEITKLFALRKKWSIEFEFRLAHVTIWSSPICDVSFLMRARPWENKETDRGMRWMCTKNFPPFGNDMWSLRPLTKPGARFSKVPKTFRARKAICEIANRLFWKADLLTCFKGNKKKNNFEVWWIKCFPFLSYKGMCDTRKWPVKFRDFWETAPRTGPDRIGPDR